MLRAMLPSEPILESRIIDLCDADHAWGPLLFLRPAKHLPLTLPRTALMAFVPGLAFGMLGSILLALAARALGVPVRSLFVFPLALSAIYFIACSLLVAPAWNRRVERLARLADFSK
jgi:hypothetical protein